MPCCFAEERIDSICGWVARIVSFGFSLGKVTAPYMKGDGTYPVSESITTRRAASSPAIRRISGSSTTLRPTAETV